jgi:hypothetical protein
VTAHHCEPPVDSIHGPDTWACPCGQVWERREEDEPDFFDAWFQPQAQA